MATRRRAARRAPKQQRARDTVEVVLEAVTRVAKRHGVAALTTNRIAEAAGVSIGSVYQYFPDKAAIYLALHDRHVEHVGELVDRTVAAHARGTLDRLVGALVDALVDEHARDPELYEVLATVPGGDSSARSLAVRLRAALERAVGSRRPALVARGARDRVLFVMANMIDSLSHAAALRRPVGLSLTEAKHETVRAVVGYLRAA
jgi:AcrR family transcriptional regulator